MPRGSGRRNNGCLKSPNARSRSGEKTPAGRKHGPVENNGSTPTRRMPAAARNLTNRDPSQSRLRFGRNPTGSAGPRNRPAYPPGRHAVSTNGTGARKTESAAFDAGRKCSAPCRGRDLRQLRSMRRGDFRSQVGSAARGADLYRLRGQPTAKIEPTLAQQ